MWKYSIRSCYKAIYTILIATEIIAISPCVAKLMTHMLYTAEDDTTVAEVISIWVCIDGVAFGILTTAVYLCLCLGRCQKAKKSNFIQSCIFYLICMSTIMSWTAEGFIIPSEDICTFESKYNNGQSWMKKGHLFYSMVRLLIIIISLLRVYSQKYLSREKQTVFCCQKIRMDIQHGYTFAAFFIFLDIVTQCYLDCCIHPVAWIRQITTSIWGAVSDYIL